MSARRPPPRAAPRRPQDAAPRPLSEREIDELQALLEALPAPLEPLEASGLDGFLAGVLVQPRPVAEAQWWPCVLDVDGRPAPPGLETTRLRHLVGRRHGQLAAAIARRTWFDPWIFDAEEAAGADAALEAVGPWAAGCALALEAFPRLLEQDDDDTLDALALVYRHLDTAHLEDAEGLLEAIDALEPPQALDAAVEDLVRATLLLADAAGLPRATG